MHFPNDSDSNEEGLPHPKRVRFTSEASTTDESIQSIDCDLDIEIDDESVENIKELLFESCKDGTEDNIINICDKIKKGYLCSSILDSTDVCGFTPLMYAVKNDQTSICNILISGGANVNVLNMKQAPALTLAAQKGSLNLVQILIGAGADSPSITTSLIPAAHFGHADLVRKFLESGGNVNHKNSKGTTALMRASQEGHEEVVALLINAGAFINESNGEGMTALMLAAQRGHANIVSALISANADVNMQTRQGSTALLLAAKRGHEGAVRVLVTAGADIFKTDERQKTARDSAERRGYDNLLSLLTMESQIQLMRHASRKERTYLFVKMSVLFVHGRAQVKSSSNHLDYCNLLCNTLKLPPPLLQNIAQMMPLSKLWPTQLNHLKLRLDSEPNEVVQEGIRIVDEVLNSACNEDNESNPNQEMMNTNGSLNCQGKLTQLRDCPDFAFRFRAWGPLSMDPDLFCQLKQMADVQGVLFSFGVSNVEFGISVASRVLSTLHRLLEWDKNRIKSY